jgi:putative transposase
MIQMSKEEFVVLLERQRSSGLSIKDFCANEAYTESSFYYWKSKFGYSRSYRTQHSEFHTEKFAPVSLKHSADAAVCSPHPTNNSSEEGQEEICIDFPSGVSVRFKGEICSGAALSLLTQICSSYVLPK